MTFEFKGYLIEVLPSLVSGYWYCQVYPCTTDSAICGLVAKDKGQAIWDAMQIVNVHLFDKSRNLKSPKN